MEGNNNLTARRDKRPERQNDMLSTTAREILDSRDSFDWIARYIVEYLYDGIDLDDTWSGIEQQVRAHDDHPELGMHPQHFRIKVATSNTWGNKPGTLLRLQWFSRSRRGGILMDRYNMTPWVVLVDCGTSAKDLFSKVESFCMLTEIPVSTVTVTTSDFADGGYVMADADSIMAALTFGGRARPCMM